MKKFIIMSLAVFALALISCKDDQKKCEDEGKVWIAEESKCITTEQKECEENEKNIWNATDKKCEEKSDAQIACEAKENMMWDAESSKCEEKSDVQVACEADAGKTWNAANKKCETAASTTPQTPEQLCNRQKDKKWEDDECVDQETFTITWKSKDTNDDDDTKIRVLFIAADRKFIALSKPGENSCAQVTEAEFEKLKISLLRKSGDIILCNNSDTDDKNNCVAGNYAIEFNKSNSMHSLVTRNSSNTAACKPIEEIPNFSLSQEF